MTGPIIPPKVEEKLPLSPTESKEFSVDSPDIPQTSEETTTETKESLPIEKPKPPVIVPPVVNPAESLLRGITRQLEELSNENKALRNRIDVVTAPPPPKKEDLNNSVWNQPHETITKIVEEQLRNQVAPLNDFVKEFRAGSKIDVIKAQYKDNPRFKDIYPKLEAMFDRTLRSLPNLDDQIVRLAFNSLVGSLYSGDLDTEIPEGSSTFTPGATTQQQQVVTELPAHLRPKGPEAPVGDKKVAGATLNETEKRLARESNLTPEQFIKLRDADSSSFLTMDLEEKK